MDEILQCRGSEPAKKIPHKAPVTEFGLDKRNKSGHRMQCKKCRAAETASRKEECFSHYGGAYCHCPCGCAETNLHCLGFAHLDDSGAAHRRELGLGNVGGSRFYAKLKKAGWPQNQNYSIQCHNCNMGAKYNGGVCPKIKQEK